jgi:hypothetical protein
MLAVPRDQGQHAMTEGRQRALERPGISLSSLKGSSPA